MKTILAKRNWQQTLYVAPQFFLLSSALVTEPRTSLCHIKVDLNFLCVLWPNNLMTKWVSAPNPVTQLNTWNIQLSYFCIVPLNLRWPAQFELSLHDSTEEGQQRTSFGSLVKVRLKIFLKGRFKFRSLNHSLPIPSDENWKCGVHFLTCFVHKMYPISQ